MWNEVFLISYFLVVHSFKFVCLTYFARLFCISVFIATLLRYLTLPYLNTFMNLQLYM